MTILLPEFISDQAMRLALSNLDKVDTNLIDPSETGKDMLKSSLLEDIQRYCQGNFLSMTISREMSFSPEKVVLCYRYKTRHMLDENCPVITPAQKDSSMSFTERSATPSRNPSSRQLDHSAEILPCLESLQQPSAPTKDVVREDRSGEVSDSDSDSESDSESCSKSDSHNEFNSGSEHSSEKFASHPSKETSSEIAKDQTNLGRLLHRSLFQMYIRNVPTRQQRNVP